ncbi:MAG: hypothetical protein LBQ66_05385 [Planctomycetaceae bacterium]|nr:hypothetical protein [Planctomycetaceae bacterium]
MPNANYAVLPAPQNQPSGYYLPTNYPAPYPQQNQNQFPPNQFQPNQIQPNQFQPQITQPEITQTRGIQHVGIQPKEIRQVTFVRNDQLNQSPYPTHKPADNLPNYTPNYAQNYAQNGTTNPQQKSQNIDNGKIRQVGVGLQDSDSGVLSAGVGGEVEVDVDSIRIDPSLVNIGARIVADSGYNQEEFQGAWRPNSGAGFWPPAEYLADGGDGLTGGNKKTGADGGHNNYPVTVDQDWIVRNLDIGDSVAHFDTIDGKTIVEASNRVHIYSPRFGAVRKIEGVINTDHLTEIGGINQKLSISKEKSSQNIGFTAQESKTGYTRNRDDLMAIKSHNIGAQIDSLQGTSGYSNFDGTMSYANTLRLSKLGSAEILHLAEGCKNAIVWQGSEGINIKATYHAPMSISEEEGVAQLFKINSEKTGNSKLRLIKVASHKSAKSGDIIVFTLRFDNLGTEPLGNVTILDSLTTRLEFVAGSAVSSVASGFAVESNGADSFTLRFEITDPLEPKQFGVVQFKCRVL